MKKILVAAVLAGSSFSGSLVSAQNRICGTDIAVDNLIAQNPQFQARYEQYVAETQQRADAYAKQMEGAAQKTTGKYNIPIVFHIVLSQAQIDEIGGTQGIYDRIASQLTVLNTCYNGQNYNQDSSRILAEFKPKFGNPNISFGMAHVKTDGSGTTGVEFKVQVSSFTGFDVSDNGIKQTVNGGLSPWDNTKYLNIWITHITTTSGNGQVLGYAYNPGLAKSMGDGNLAGVVVDYLAFGKRTSPIQHFFSTSDQGRTMVHEIGHYFTLNHIWGNTSPGVNPSCSDDDGVSDTPIQSDANQSTCPTGVKANCTNAAGGEMYMDYMDYVQDKCMVMFSQGQVTRMQSEFSPGGGSYNLQFNSVALNWPTGISNIESQNAFDIVPNPASGMFHISFVQSTESLRSVTLLNMMGQVVKQMNVESQKNDVTVDVSNIPAGIYSVNCKFDEGTVTRKIVLQ